MKSLFQLVFAAVLGLAYLLPANTSAYRYRGRYYPVTTEGTITDTFTVGVVMNIGTAAVTICTGLGYGHPGYYRYW